MVDDDHVPSLVDSTDLPTSELNKVCKRSSEPLVSPFDEANCVDDTAVVHEYTEGGLQEESVCMMADVGDSCEEKPMIRMDGVRVSIVCDGQTEEHESSHDHVQDHNG